MAAKFTIQTVFAAIDQMTGPIGKMSAKVGDLGAKAGAVAGKIGDAFKATGVAVGAAGAAMAGAALGIYKLAEDVSTYGDTVAKTARAIGMASDRFQEFRYIGERSGVSIDEMDVALKKLTVNLGDASSETIKSLGKLGLTVDQLKAAGPDESLFIIADGFAKITDPAERAAVAVDLFGKQGVKMGNVLAEGRGGLSALADEAHRLGYVMGEDALAASEKLNDSILNMKTAFGAIGRELAAKFMPLVNSAVDGMTEFLVENRGVFDTVAEGLVQVFKGIGPIVADMLPVFANLVKIVGTSLLKAFKAVAPILERIFTIIEEILPPISEIVAIVVDLLSPALEVVAEIFKIIQPIISAIARGIAWLAGIVSSVLKPVIEGIKIGFESIGKIAAAVWEGIAAAFKWVWENLLKPYIDFLVAFWTGVWEGIKSVAVAVWDGISAAAVWVWENVLRPVGEAIGGFFAGIWDGIATAGGAVWDGLASGLTWVWENVLRPVGEAIGGFFAGIWDGIASAFGWALGGIIDIINLMIDGVNFLAGWAGVSIQKIEKPGKREAAATPMSPATTSYSTSVSRSEVDITLGNAPAGTSMTQRGSAPGVSLNLGYAGAR